MADLGAVGREADHSTAAVMSIVRTIAFGGPAFAGDFSVGLTRENVEGNPLPCLVMAQPGKFRFRWVVAAGARTIECEVKQAVNAAPFPTLRVLAHPEIGIAADVVGTAGAGADWKTIGPVAIAPTLLGAVWVELENLHNASIPPSPCYWDNVAVT